jgi:hypothetical protein
MPRFIWRACAFHQGNREIELLFDATDIEQGRCLFELIDHRVGLADYFRAIAKSFELPEEFRLRGEAKIFEWFASPI